MSHVKLLSRKAVGVRTDMSEEEEALFEAVTGGNLTSLRHVLRDYKIDLDCLNGAGCTAMGLAAQEGFLHIVKLLLERHCDVNKADFYGLTPLQYATEFGNVNVAEFLIKAGANVDWMDENNDGLSAIHIAACKGETAAAQLLIQSGCNINAQDINGVSVLHCAVANGHRDIVESLLKAGADLNPIGSRTKRTPLHLAADVGDEAMVRLLIKHGAKMNLQDGFGLTPLCAMCLQNKTDIAKYMIKSRAKVNIADNKNNLPLHYAARNGNSVLTEILIQSGSKVNSLNNHFEGSLHLAIRMHHMEVIKMLVKNGCDTNMCEHYGSVTPLHVAVNTYTEVHKFNQVVESLIEGGVWMDCRAFSSLETPLYRALDQDKVDIALCLLQHGADANVDCPFDVTILHKACQRRHFQVVEMLLHCGLDWNRETWLQMDIFSSGINPKLLKGFAEDIPMVLLDNFELFLRIEDIWHNPVTLIRLCRMCIRRQMKDKLFLKVKQLDMPQKVQDFLMLKII